MKHIITLLILLSATAVFGQDPAAPAIESETSLLDVYKQGGWMMHILLVCSVGTIAIAVYCFVQITAKRMAPKSNYETLLRHVRENNIPEAYSIATENDNAFNRVVSSGLLKFNSAEPKNNKGSMEQAAADALDQEETRNLTWVNYLNVFATIAPMIGLLGTVTGMIKSFDKLKTGQSEPSDLAGGIGEAMTTTAGGLLVGIPAMFFFFFFRNRLTGLVSKIQKDATFLIDVASGEVKLD